MRRADKLFLGALGGTHAIAFWLLFLLASAVAEVLMTGQTWFLGIWAHQYEGRDAPQVNAAL